MSLTQSHKIHFFGSFLKDLTLYAVEPIVSKLVSFLLIPLYTAYLLPEEFGNLQFVLSIGAFLRSFSQMGMNTAFWKFRGADSGVEKSSVSLSLTVAQLYLSLLVVAGLLVYYYSFSEQPILTGLLLLYFGALSVKVISENALLMARANRTPTKYLQISLLQTAFLLVANLVFLVLLNKGIWGVVYAYFCSFTLIGLLYFPYLYKSYAKHHDWKLTLQMLKFGFPVMLANLSLLILSLSDRWFLKTYTTDLELGLYAYTYKFADLIATFIVYTFQLAWIPVAWKVFDQDNGPNYFASMKRMIYLFFPFFCFTGVFVLTILAQWMTVDKSYLGGFEIIICLAFSHVFYGFYLFYNTALLFRKKQTLSLLINFTIGALTIAVNFAVIPIYGLKGAAWVTFISYFILFLIIKILSTQYYKHPSNFWKELGIIFTMIACVSLVYLSYQSAYSLYWKASTSLAAGLVYLAILHFTGYISLHFVKVQLNALRQSKKTAKNG